ncbi:MAG: TonB-dependent receptor [Alcanivorax sp.]|nr:TonB-dependent receptor [Alcanivorax sp.]
MDRKFMMAGLGYAMLGLILGIYMAASHNHGQLVTHAHIMLIGFVVSVVYALCHKLWLLGGFPRVARTQYYLHQAGTLAVVCGLFLLYGQFAREEVLEPLLAVGSIAVLAGMVMMKFLFIRDTRKGA